MRQRIHPIYEFESQIQLLQSFILKIVHQMGLFPTVERKKGKEIKTFGFPDLSKDSPYLQAADLYHMVGH